MVFDCVSQNVWTYFGSLIFKNVYAFLKLLHFRLFCFVLWSSDKHSLAELNLKTLYAISMSFLSRNVIYAVKMIIVGKIYRQKLAS